VKLTQITEPDSTSNWKVGISEISCSSLPEGANLVLNYCNMISPQFVGVSTVRSMQTFRLYLSATCQHEIRNVHYTNICPSKTGNYNLYF